MSDQCVGEQRLCPVTIGDAFPFNCEFENVDETPKDISGMKLIFTMKLDRKSNDGIAGDLFYEMIFPDNQESVDGKGYMLVPKEKTAALIANKDYHYAFKAIDDGEPYSIGSGMVYAKINTIKASA